MWIAADDDDGLVSLGKDAMKQRLLLCLLTIMVYQQHGPVRVYT